MDTKKLQDWAVVSPSDPYLPPEIFPKRLRGRLVDSGKEIVTSPIKNVVGRMVETRNSIYELVGPPEPGYAEYCEKIGREIDPEQPIKIIGATP